MQRQNLDLKELSRRHKLPPRHRLLKTEDGSYSLHSNAFDEGLHSRSGAWAETLFHFIQGCQVCSQSEKVSRAGRRLTVLDVGFGAGLNCAALAKTVDSFLCVSVEMDVELIKWNLRSFWGPQGFVVTREKISYAEVFLLEKDRQQIIILGGDARETLPAYLQTGSTIRFDCIFQDAFSSKKNPNLWTVEWFSLLRRYASEGAILSTYASSDSIRKSLLEADWPIENGGPFGKKRSSTRCHLGQKSDPAILEQLARSPLAPLRD